eukprot:3362066-Prymnesium_polylepis.1
MLPLHLEHGNLRMQGGEMAWVFGLFGEVCGVNWGGDQVVASMAHHAGLQNVHGQLVDVVEVTHQQVNLLLGAVLEEGERLLVHVHPNVGPVVLVLRHVLEGVLQAVLDGVRRIRSPRAGVIPQRLGRHLLVEVDALHPDAVLGVVGLVRQGLDLRRPLLGKLGAVLARARRGRG